MAASDPTVAVPTPTGALQGVAAFSWDGSAWQPAGRAGPSVATPTGVLQGVAPFSWDGSLWQPTGRATPDVATPSGVLDGVAVYTWSGSAWVPPGGTETPSTPSGALRGVASFSWDGSAWQPAAQAGPSVATPFGLLDGVAMFNWSGTAWAAVGAPSLDLSFMTPGTLDPRITFTRASTATYFDSTGTMQTAANDTPRWDYDAVTHVLRGLLIEQSRANLLLNSATLGTQSLSVSAQAYTLSFYGTGTITLSGTSSGSLVGTGAFPQRVNLTFTPTAGTLTFTVTGSVLSAQFEAGSFPTSYIATAGVSVTRQADSAIMPTSPWYTNALAAALAVDAMVPSGGDGTYMQFDDGTTNNRMAVTSALSTHISNASEFVSGSAVFNSSAQGAITLGSIFKLGYSTAASLRSYALNGAVPTVATGNASVPPIVTTLRLGKGVGATTGSFYLRRARYWPRTLSNAELQSVTT